MKWTLGFHFLHRCSPKGLFDTLVIIRCIRTFDSSVSGETHKLGVSKELVVLNTGVELDWVIYDQKISIHYVVARERYLPTI